MAFGKIVVDFPSDMMDHVDVKADSNLAYSIVNGYEPSSPSHISSIDSSEEPAEDAVQYYQCAQSEEDSFIACCVCGSIIELGTYCPCSVMSSFLQIRDHALKSRYHIWQRCCCCYSFVLI